MQNKEFWEKNGKEWTRILEEQRIASRSVTNQALIAEVHRLQPRSILDLGCGEGWLARALPKNIRYYGVDGSQSLIQSAKEKNKTQKFSVVSYDDIAAKKWILEEKTDLVVFNFSLLDKEIVTLLKSSSDFLEDTGHIVIQTLHPCFSAKEYVDQWNEDDFSTVSREISGKMPWYQRTLSSWTDVFTDVDLVIKKLAEPVSDGKPASLIFTLKKL